MSKDWHSYTFQESETIGGFRVRDRLACFLLVLFVRLEFRVRDRMALKKKREKLVFVCKKLAKFKCVKF